MWLVYDTRTGAVVDGPCASSSWPDEVPEEAALVNVAPEDKEYAEVLTYHDEEDAEEIAAIFELATTNQLLVVDGEVTAGMMYPPPMVAPPEMTAEDQYAALEARVTILEQQVATLMEA